MQLQQRQELLQNEMVKDFEKKLEELKENKRLKRSNVLKFYDELRTKIEEEKEQKLHEVINKIVKEEKKRFERFGAKLGNSTYIRTYSKELTKKLLDYLKLPLFKRKADEELESLLELIAIDKNYYKIDFIQSLKENPQKIYFLTWPITPEKLAALTLDKIMELFTNDKLESKEIIFQAVADSLGSYIAGYLRYVYHDNKKIETLDDELEITIGAYFINIVIDLEYVQERFIPDEKEDLKKLFLSNEFLQKLSKTERDFIKSAPFRYEPMVIEPFHWQEMYGGGYLQNHFKFKLPLMKMHTRVDREYLSDMQIPQQILDAINFLQKVPYKINRQILDVLLDYEKELKYIKKQFKVSYKYYFIFKTILSKKLYEKSRADLEKYILEELKNNLNKNKKRLSAEDRNIIDDVVKRINESDKERLAKEVNIEYELAKLKNSFIAMLDIAQKYKEFEKIYFCWNMDFRGRIYPIQSLLHPQGSDVAKSLLLFADEEKLDADGVKWFKIHGANSYAEVDKEPFDVRVKWIEEHEEEILASAINPKEASFWKGADDPFRFLAFCFEYKRYKENPADFTTGLPIAIDGSNNGFQHISTMLRDTKGAISVNVLPNPEGKVMDFYMDVLEELKKKIENLEIKEFDKIGEDGFMYKYGKERDYRDGLPKLLEDLKEYERQKLFEQRGQKNITTHFFEIYKQPEALKEIMDNCEEISDEKDDRKLLKRIIRCIESEIDNFEIDKDDGIVFEKRGKTYKKVEKIVPKSLLKAIDVAKLDRKFIKKPAMTHSYGSETGGKARAIREYILDHDILKLPIPSNYIPLFAKELAELIEESIESISSSSVVYRDFMKKCAKKIAKKDEIVSWKTPLGLRVKQLEFKQKSKRILGNTLTIRVYERDENGDLIVDETKQQNGLPPNFVHSIDATHLYMTLLELKKEGINSIATVHDSFATTANNVERLSKILRKTFIELHKQQILKNFKEQLEKEHAIACDAIQYIDEDFDFEKIKDAIYMFS